MAKTVAEMTTEELRRLINSTVEEKLVELLGDPDADLAVRNDVRRRLLRQKRAVEEGERGESLESVASRLRLA